MSLPLGYLAIETMDAKKSEFPQERHVRRRKRLRSGASQRRNLSSGKISHRSDNLPDTLFSKAFLLPSV